MLTSSGCDNNQVHTKPRSLNRASSSSSSSRSPSSSSSSFSQPVHNLNNNTLLSPNPNRQTRTMEEVWKDINLSSREERDLSETPNTHNNHNSSFHGVILQDFLGTPFNTRDKYNDNNTGIIPTSLGPPGKGNINSFVCSSSLSPPPVTVLSLTPGPEFHFLDNSSPLTSNNTNTRLDGQMAEVSAFSSPFDALASGGVPFGKKRVGENGSNSCDRRHKRMIKNRESAARSRARKQAYTTELELEVAHLMEENAKLRKQQEQLRVAANAQQPKKKPLHRSSTAPF